jgi:hypothetical protein
MAFKSFKKLSSRNQSTLISQLHKLINYYSSIFATRERIHLKKISQQDGSIYWLEDDTKKLAASAILDPNYSFSIGPIHLKTLGHTISKRPGQMDRLLNHVFQDHKDNSIMFLCKPFVAESISSDEFDLTELTPVEMSQIWPELANIKTDYFNVKNESLSQGMSRKQHNAYFKFAQKDIDLIKDLFPSIWTKINP